jgi:hypothetical protein
LGIARTTSAVLGPDGFVRIAGEETYATEDEWLEAAEKTL